MEQSFYQFLTASALARPLITVNMLCAISIARDAVIFRAAALALCKSIKKLMHGATGLYAKI